MTIKMNVEETDRDRTVIWFSDSPRDALLNPNGVTHEHPTAVVQGAVEFRFREKTIVVKAGETVVLPLGLGYDVIVTSFPAEVRCTYSKDVPGAAESVAHLLATVVAKGGSVDFITHDEAKATPKSVAVEDWKGEPVLATELLTNAKVKR